MFRLSALRNEPANRKGLCSLSGEKRLDRRKQFAPFCPEHSPAVGKGGHGGESPARAGVGAGPLPMPQSQSCAACCTWRRSRMRLSLFPSLCLRPAPPHLEPAPPLLQTAGGRSPLPDPPPRRPCSCLDPAPSRLDLPKPPRPKLGCRFFSTPVPTCYVDRRSFAPVCDACESKTNDRDRSVGPFCRA